jgi:hypothetical protein
MFTPVKSFALLLLVAGLSFGVAPSATAKGATQLKITAEFIKGEKPKVWTLKCDPTSGNHPKPKAACALVKKRGAALFKPVPADSMCTQIYGGDQRVRVTGTLKGKKISATFTRTDGCEIARYDAAAILFGLTSSV